VLNLINEDRLAAGKSTLGFIHPVIVSFAFFHILSTEGNADI
jgi:hypothetical protein